jgi:hypothetical protein
MAKRANDEAEAEKAAARLAAATLKRRESEEEKFKAAEREASLRATAVTCAVETDQLSPSAGVRCCTARVLAMLDESAAEHAPCRRRLREAAAATAAASDRATAAAAAVVAVRTSVKVEGTRPARGSNAEQTARAAEPDADSACAESAGAPRRLRRFSDTDPDDVTGASELGRMRSIRLINIDLPRTFPELSFFHGDFPEAEALRQVLETYVCYRPDVGYVQGMSYVTAMLLLYMDAYSAFQCLANLLASHLYFDLYRLDSRKMDVHLRVYDALFREQLPDLAGHFDGIGVRSSMYMIDWLLTVFSRALPLDVSSRVWDCYLCAGLGGGRTRLGRGGAGTGGLGRGRGAGDGGGGELFLYRVALAICKVFGQQLRSMELGDVLKVLTCLPAGLDEDVLFAAIATVRVSEARFRELLRSERAAEAAEARARAQGLPLPDKGITSPKRSPMDKPSGGFFNRVLSPLTRGKV